MKKFFLIALIAISLVDAAQAQTSTPQTRSSANGAITNNTAQFKYKADEMKAALQADDFIKAETYFTPIYTMVAKRGDEIRKVNNDIAGSDNHYRLVGRLKDLHQNMSGNKADLILLLDEMKTAY